MVSRQEYRNVYICIYRTHNVRKPDVAETFIRNLSNKVYNHITALSRNV